MKILIILAAYNGAKYIEEQIESILNQKSVSVAIMVFDDCSSDATLQVLEKYHTNTNVTICKRTRSTGSAANNFFEALKSLENATINSYDFFAFSDQDDVWLPNKLGNATQMLQQQEASLYCSNLILWDEKNNTTSIIHKSDSQKKYDFLFEGGSAGCTYVFTTQFCFSLKNVLENTNFKEWKFFSHDWFVYFYARINNFKVSIDSNAYIKYRIHANNIHGQLNKSSLSALNERLKLVKQGWYFKQIAGFINFTKPQSTEHKIYKLFVKNYFSRLYVLVRYNFELMRSSKKSIQFFLIHLIPLRINKEV